MEKFKTNYKVATQWLGNSYILCNGLEELDETIGNNLRFHTTYEDGSIVEIYQFFLTDCSEDEVEYLEDNFDLKFTYSELLGLYVLCVDHYGTAWDYVYCETTNENAARKLGECK